MELHQLMGVNKPGDIETPIVTDNEAWLGRVFGRAELTVPPELVGETRQPLVNPRVEQAKARALEDPLTTRMINSLAQISTVGGIVYLASPYTKYPAGLDAAWRGVCEAAAELIRGGLSIYSPIAHSHPIALYGGIDPKDHALWMTQCHAMMRAASSCIVLKMPGYKESIGVNMEIEYFDKAGKPIIFIDPNILRGLPAHGLS